MSADDEALATLQAALVECRRCERLVAWREKVAETKRAAFRHETYWGRPVPMLGGAGSRLLVVGLAPAAHGANRTGRMFTGDRSGDWLFRAMHRAGFASQSDSVSTDDGLELRDASITAIVRCAPPDNKPTTQERQTCQGWLDEEMGLLSEVRVIMCLGGLAFTQTLRVLADRGLPIPRPRPRFGHAVEAEAGPLTLIASYHPSQQNTFTGRLTEPMLDQVFTRAGVLLDRST